MFVLVLPVVLLVFGHGIHPILPLGLDNALANHIVSILHMRSLFCLNNLCFGHGSEVVFIDLLLVVVFLGVVTVFTFIFDHILLQYGVDLAAVDGLAQQVLALQRLGSCCAFPTVLALVHLGASVQVSF